MALREVYIGSVGPFLYDDEEPMPGQENEANPDLQKAVSATGAGEYGFLVLSIQEQSEIGDAGSDKVTIFIEDITRNLYIRDEADYKRILFESEVEDLIQPVQDQLDALEVVVNDILDDLILLEDRVQELEDATLSVVSIDDTDSPYTVPATANVILVDATNNDIIVNLPAAITPPVAELSVKRIDTAAANDVTIQPDGSETIDGGASHVLNNQYDSIQLVSDGGNWFIVAST